MKVLIWIFLFPGKLIAPFVRWNIREEVLDTGNKIKYQETVKLHSSSGFRSFQEFVFSVLVWGAVGFFAYTYTFGAQSPQGRADRQERQRQAYLAEGKRFQGYVHEREYVIRKVTEYENNLFIIETDGEEVVVPEYSIAELGRFAKNNIGKKVLVRYRQCEVGISNCVLEFGSIASHEVKGADLADKEPKVVASVPVVASEDAQAVGTNSSNVTAATRPAE